MLAPHCGQATILPAMVQRLQKENDQPKTDNLESYLKKRFLEEAKNPIKRAIIGEKTTFAPARYLPDIPGFSKFIIADAKTAFIHPQLFGDLAVLEDYNKHYSAYKISTSFTGLSVYSGLADRLIYVVEMQENSPAPLFVFRHENKNIVFLDKSCVPSDEMGKIILAALIEVVSREEVNCGTSIHEVNIVSSNNEMLLRTNAENFRTTQVLSAVLFNVRDDAKAGRTDPVFVRVDISTPQSYISSGTLAVRLSYLAQMLELLKDEKGPYEILMRLSGIDVNNTELVKPEGIEYMQNEIRGAVEGAHIQPYINIRENAQNSRDEARKSGSGKRLIITAEPNGADKNTLVLSFEDNIGMSLMTVLKYYLVPVNSDKRDNRIGLTGKHGVGAFTNLRGAKEVRIKTSCGDGWVTRVTLTPVKDEQGCSMFFRSVP